MLDFTKILEQIGAVFQLQEQLASLSKSNPALAWLIVLILAIFIANIAITQLVELIKKFSGGQSHSRFAWVGLVLGFSAAALVSWGVVLNLRQVSASIPELNVDEDTVIGRPLMLKWKYDGKEKNVRFEIQSSSTADFGEEDDVKSLGLWYGSSLLVEQVNDERYWRIRQVDKNRRAGRWSSPIRITQYASSLERIKKRKYVNVYISDSFNEAFFKFTARNPDNNYQGYDLSVIGEIIKKLPAKLGIDTPLEYDPEPVNWTSLLEAPGKGLADIIISTITATKKREEKLAIKFSLPYYCTRQSLVYRPPQLSQPIARMIEGKKIGVQKNTTSKEILELFQTEMAENGKFELHEYPQAADVMDAVVKRAVDYGFTDTPFASAGQLQYGTGVLGYRELIGPEDFPDKLELERRVEKYAIAVRSGEEDLMRAIDEIIDDMKKEKLGKLLQEAVTDFYTLQKDKIAPVIDYTKDPSECR